MAQADPLHYSHRACYLRQTLVFSEFLTPEINGFFSKYLKNVSGKIKIKQRYEDGSILDVIPQVQQTFTRIDTTSLAAMNDTRFKYFIEKVTDWIMWKMAICLFVI